MPRKIQTDNLSFYHDLSKLKQTNASSLVKGASFCYIEITRDRMEKVAKTLQTKAQIRSLSLCFSNNNIEVTWLPISYRLGPLTNALQTMQLPPNFSLTVHSNAIGDAGAALFAEVIHPPTNFWQPKRFPLPIYFSLNLHNNQIGDAGAQALADALQNAVLPRGFSLNLSNNNIGIEGVLALAHALQNTELPENFTLDLSGNPFGIEGVLVLLEALQHARLPKGFTLALCNLQIGPEDMHAFAEKLQHIQLPRSFKLFLTGNIIGDNGACILAETLRHMALPQHFVLSLHKNGLSSVGIQALHAAFSDHYDVVAHEAEFHCYPPELEPPLTEEKKSTSKKRSRRDRQTETNTISQAPTKSPNQPSDTPGMKKTHKIRLPIGEESIIASARKSLKPVSRDQNNHLGDKPSANSESKNVRAPTTLTPDTSEKKQKRTKKPKKKEKRNQEHTSETVTVNHQEKEVSSSLSIAHSVDDPWQETNDSQTQSLIETQLASFTPEDIKNLRLLIGQASQLNNLSLSQQELDTLINVISASNTFATQNDLKELYASLSDDKTRLANKEEAFIATNPVLYDYYQIASFLLVRTHYVFLSIDDGRFEQANTGTLLTGAIGEGLNATLKSMPGISAVAAIVEYIVGEVLSEAEGRFYVRKLLSLALLPNDMDRLARQFSREMAIRLREDIPQNPPNKKDRGLKARCHDIWQHVKQEVLSSSITNSVMMDEDNTSHQQAFEDVTEMLLALFNTPFEDIQTHCHRKPLHEVVSFLVELAITRRRARKGDAHVHAAELLEESLLDKMLFPSQAPISNSPVSPMFFSSMPSGQSSTESKEEQEKFYRLEERFESLQSYVQGLSEQSASGHTVDGHQVAQMQQTITQLTRDMNTLKKELKANGSRNQGSSGGSMMLMQSRPEENQPMFAHDSAQQAKEIGDLENRINDLAQLLAFNQDDIEALQSILESQHQDHQRPFSQSSPMESHVSYHLQESLNAYIAKIEKANLDVSAGGLLSLTLFKERTAHKHQCLAMLKAALEAPSTLNMRVFDDIETRFPTLLTRTPFNIGDDILRLFEQVRSFVSSHQSDLNQILPLSLGSSG